MTYPTKNEFLTTIVNRVTTLITSGTSIELARYLGLVYKGCSPFELKHIINLLEASELFEHININQPVQEKAL